MNSIESKQSEHVLGFCKALAAKGRQPPTVESYGHDASRFLDYLATLKLLPHRVEAESLIQYQTHLRDDCHESENTVRRAVIGVRQFYRYLAEQRVIVESPFDMVAIPDRQEALPTVDYEQIGKLIAAVSADAACSFITARNAAIICLLGLEAVKATELIAMHWGDLVDQSLWIRGNKARTLTLHAETLKALEIYRKFFADIEDHPKMKAEKVPRMFVAFKGRDASVLIPKLSRHGLKFIVYELGNECGIGHLNSEILRHHAVNLFIHSGLSSDEIMARLGLRRAGNIAKHIASSRHHES